MGNFYCVTSCCFLFSVWNFLSLSPQEKLSFSCHRHLDVLLAVDIFLGPIDDPDITPPERQQLVLQNFPGVSAFVHQINLGEDPNRPQT